MDRTLYTNALLIDGTGQEPVHNGAMLVEDNKIAAVGKSADFTTEPDTEVVNCQGKSLMPGMINAHMHFIYEPYTWDREAFREKSIPAITLDYLDNMHKTLESGVTFCRELGCPNFLDMEFKNLIRDGRVQGPEFISAGQYLTITGGSDWKDGCECDGPMGFVKGVRTQIKAGADVIKIMTTDCYGRPKMKVNHKMMADTFLMTQEEIKASTDEAHKMGKLVAAHCNGYIGVYNSVMNGVDSIEHGQFRDSSLPEVYAIIEEMVKRGTWLVPTLSAFFKEYDRAVVEENYQEVIKSFRLCHEAGVKIAMGNDAGVPWVGHDKAAKEVEHMSLYGMSNMEAIVASTLDAARLLGINGEYGSLEAGKFADFLVLNENPLDNIRTLQHVNQVYKLGKLVNF